MATTKARAAARKATRRTPDAEAARKTSRRPSLSEMRNAYRACRKNAGSQVSLDAWDAEVKAVAGRLSGGKAPTPSQWLRAAREATVACENCRGTGLYSWGGTTNGKPAHTGPCFRCRGTGRQGQDDFRRNFFYDAHRKVRLA